MYPSLLLPWSPNPSAAESLYRASGLVKTKGTIFIPPPSPATLRSSFNAPPRPQTRMSSGAVALCKHFERGGASSEQGGKPHPFWTLPKGSNEEKTATAKSVLDRMLEDARWKNVLMLHTGVVVYEVRNGRGYGMRWTLDLQPTTVHLGDPASNEEVVGNADAAGGAEGAPENWQVSKTTFRGFLEPIAETNHELEDD